MKGVELPINILVIVAIAVIVLLGLIALYFIGWGPFAGAAGLEGIKNAACRELVQQYNCAVDTNTIDVTTYDADGDGAAGTADTGTGWDWATSTCGGAIGDNGDNLASLCACSYLKTSEAACKALCACPGY